MTTTMTTLRAAARTELGTKVPTGRQIHKTVTVQRPLYDEEDGSIRGYETETRNIIVAETTTVLRMPFRKWLRSPNGKAAAAALMASTYNARAKRKSPKVLAILAGPR